MRTYEDVKLALTKYREELENEKKAKNEHYVVVGGNMCVRRQGITSNYILDKGDPTPMIKQTAENHFKKNKEKITDDIKLEIIPYAQWLTTNISECEKLCDCMDNSLQGDPITTPAAQPVQGNTLPTLPTVPRPITSICESCPIETQKCWACRFCMGIDTSGLEWTVNCAYTKK